MRYVMLTNESCLKTQAYKHAHTDTLYNIHMRVHTHTHTHTHM